MARSAKAGGKRSVAKTRKARSAKGRTPRKPKRPIRSDSRSDRAAASDIELKEAREQQAATAEILKVIASSPSDVQPVFEAIAASANRLIGGFSTGVYRYVGNMVHIAAFTPTTPEADAALQAMFPVPRWEIPPVAVMENGDSAQITDSETADSRTIRISRVRGWRSVLFTPLMNKDVPIGFISVNRRETGGFADHHVQLLQTFADQAVIAIENARLFNETKEALAQQQALADILSVISNSVSDSKPVFEEILRSVRHLFDVEDRVIFLSHHGLLHIGAIDGPNADVVRELFPVPLRGTVSDIAMRERRHITYDDVLNGEEVPDGLRAVAARFGQNYSIATAPLLAGDRALGALVVTRVNMKPFSENECVLLQTLADQAVIAIENARLFNETQEALERQTATANILKVIASSPSDVQPVFDAIGESANKLAGAHGTTVLRIVGDRVELAAFTPVSKKADAVLRSSFPHPIEGNPHYEKMRRGEIAEAADTEAAHSPLREIARARGYRSRLLVPLKDDSGVVGAISVTRKEPGAFSAHHLQLLQTFADQAVIAIENARLFNETQEALTRQTATADVLKVIASSPSNLLPVFDAIAERSKTLIGGHSTTVVRYVGGIVELASFTPVSPEADATLQALFPMRPDTDPQFAPILRGEIALIVDAETELQNAAMRKSARARGWRSRLLVPLKDETGVVGWISVTRKEAGGFAEKDVELLQTFADQAVIAISNVGLFEEVQSRTRELEESLEQQTATSEVLQVISSSPGELEPVFRIMLENATRVCGANFGMMQLWNGETFETAAAYNVPPAFAALREGKPIHVRHPQSGLSDVLKSHQVVHIHDITKGAAYLGGDPNVVELADIGGARTVVLVPMLKKDEFIGTFTIYRQEARPFTDKQIALVENFTKQAVIAIENTRLLRQLRERTDALSQSLDELRTAQDRLVQTEKLASLGQLTAGIAHEIKNPLNFVNNFSSLSVELIDEMTEVFENPALDEANRRKELDEIRELLKGNLEKVVQHGRRADSIVKNMLLHSREGSGERRSAEINRLVEESLSLAYHGARAEKAGFTITLKHDLDPKAGALDLYPQEMTRALLNLISNGFYAATKRKADAADESFEAVLSAATRNLGKTVEIRIRDNGTGIPPEVREKMFNPFFTTKPTGEGTGLGLSMTHDIIVKQHGGRIDVVTEPGLFTEFVITLPRGDGTAARLEPD